MNVKIYPPNSQEALAGFLVPQQKGSIPSKFTTGAGEATKLISYIKSSGGVISVQPNEYLVPQSFGERIQGRISIVMENPPTFTIAANGPVVFGSYTPAKKSLPGFWVYCFGLVPKRVNLRLEYEYYEETVTTIHQKWTVKMGRSWNMNGEDELDSMAAHAKEAFEMSMPKALRDNMFKPDFNPWSGKGQNFITKPIMFDKNEHDFFMSNTNPNKQPGLEFEWVKAKPAGRSLESDMEGLVPGYYYKTEKGSGFVVREAVQELGYFVSKKLDRKVPVLFWVKEVEGKPVNYFRTKNWMDNAKIYVGENVEGYYLPMGFSSVEYGIHGFADTTQMQNWPFKASQEGVFGRYKIDENGTLIETPKVESKTPPLGSDDPAPPGTVKGIIYFTSWHTVFIDITVQITGSFIVTDADANSKAFLVEYFPDFSSLNKGELKLLSEDGTEVFQSGTYEGYFIPSRYSSIEYALFGKVTVTEKWTETHRFPFTLEQDAVIFGYMTRSQLGPPSPRPVETAVAVTLTQEQIERHQYQYNIYYGYFYTSTTVTTNGFFIQNNQIRIGYFYFEKMGLDYQKSIEMYFYPLPRNNDKVQLAPVSPEELSQITTKKGPFVGVFVPEEYVRTTSLFMEFGTEITVLVVTTSSFIGTLTTPVQTGYYQVTQQAGNVTIAEEVAEQQAMTVTAPPPNSEYGTIFTTATSVVFVKQFESREGTFVFKQDTSVSFLATFTPVKDQLNHATLKFEVSEGLKQYEGKKIEGWFIPAEFTTKDFGIAGTFTYSSDVKVTITMTLEISGYMGYYQRSAKTVEAVPTTPIVSLSVIKEETSQTTFSFQTNYEQTTMQQFSYKFGMFYQNQKEGVFIEADSGMKGTFVTSEKVKFAATFYPTPGKLDAGRLVPKIGEQLPPGVNGTVKGTFVPYEYPTIEYGIGMTLDISFENTISVKTDKVGELGKFKIEIKTEQSKILPPPPKPVKVDDPKNPPENVFHGVFFANEVGGIFVEDNNGKYGVLQLVGETTYSISAAFYPTTTSAQIVFEDSEAVQKLPTGVFYATFLPLEYTDVKLGITGNISVTTLTTSSFLFTYDKKASAGFFFIDSSIVQPKPPAIIPMSAPPPPPVLKPTPEARYGVVFHTKAKTTIFVDAEYGIEGLFIPEAFPAMNFSTKFVAEDEKAGSFYTDREGYVPDFPKTVEKVPGIFIPTGYTTVEYGVRVTIYQFLLKYEMYLEINDVGVAGYYEVSQSGFQESHFKAATTPSPFKNAPTTTLKPRIQVPPMPTAVPVPVLPPPTTTSDTAPKPTKAPAVLTTTPAPAGEEPKSPETQMGFVFVTAEKPVFIEKYQIVRGVFIPDTDKKTSLDVIFTPDENNLKTTTMKAENKQQWEMLFKTDTVKGTFVAIQFTSIKYGFHGEVKKSTTETTSFTLDVAPTMGVFMESYVTTSVTKFESVEFSYKSSTTFKASQMTIVKKVEVADATTFTGTFFPNEMQGVFIPENEGKPGIFVLDDSKDSIEMIFYPSLTNPQGAKLLPRYPEDIVTKLSGGKMSGTFIPAEYTTATFYQSGDFLSYGVHGTFSVSLTTSSFISFTSEVTSTHGIFKLFTVPFVPKPTEVQAVTAKKTEIMLTATVHGIYYKVSETLGFFVADNMFKRGVFKNDEASIAVEVLFFPAPYELQVAELILVSQKNMKLFKGTTITGNFIPYDANAGTMLHGTIIISNSTEVTTQCSFTFNLEISGTIGNFRPSAPEPPVKPYQITTVTTRKPPPDSVHGILFNNSHNGFFIQDGHAKHGDLIFGEEKFEVVFLPVFNVLEKAQIILHDPADGIKLSGKIGEIKVAFVPQEFRKAGPARGTEGTILIMTHTATTFVMVLNIPGVAGYFHVSRQLNEREIVASQELNSLKFDVSGTALIIPSFGKTGSLTIVGSEEKLTVTFYPLEGHDESMLVVQDSTKMTAMFKGKLGLFMVIPYDRSIYLLHNNMLTVVLQS